MTRTRAAWYIPRKLGYFSLESNEIYSDAIKQYTIVKIYMLDLYNVYLIITLFTAASRLKSKYQLCERYSMMNFGQVVCMSDSFINQGGWGQKLLWCGSSGNMKKKIISMVNSMNDV